MKKIKTSRDDFSTYIICYFGYSLWSVDFALLRGPTNIFSNCSHGLKSFLATKLSQIFLLAEHELRITADDDWTTNENKIELKFLRCANEKTREVGKWDRCTHTFRDLRKIFGEFRVIHGRHELAVSISIADVVDKVPLRSHLLKTS